MKGFFFDILCGTEPSVGGSANGKSALSSYIRRYLLRGAGTVSAVRCGVVLVRYLDGECGLGWHVVVGQKEA